MKNSHRQRRNAIFRKQDSLKKSLTRAFSVRAWNHVGKQKKLSATQPGYTVAIDCLCRHVRNTSSCKLHKVSKGFQTNGSCINPLSRGREMRDDTRNGCNRRRMGSGSLVGILGKFWLLNRQREPAKKASCTIYCLKNFGAIKKGPFTVLIHGRTSP